MVVNNKFWRLEPVHGTDPASIFDSPALTAPTDFTRKLKRLDGIVVGAWDPDTEQGKVHGLGVVREVDEHIAVVDWRQVNFTLRPTGSGATQWRKRPFFRFAALVAERYKLRERFNEAFAERSGPPPAPQAPAQAPVRKNQSSAVAVLAGNDEPIEHLSPEVKSSSPQCNRVAPDGAIFATPDRGMFMGNRTSPPRWLICELHFQRDLQEPRKYTKLFFLDEAVALAAGHRPCNTCRRDRYQAYIAAVSSEIGIGRASDLDASSDSPAITHADGPPSLHCPMEPLSHWIAATTDSSGAGPCICGHQAATSNHLRQNSFRLTRLPF